MSNLTVRVLLALVVLAGCAETPPPYPKGSPRSEDTTPLASDFSPGTVRGPVGGPGGTSGGTGGGTVVTTPVASATPGKAPVGADSGQPEPPIRAGLARMPGYRASVSAINPSSGNSDGLARGYNLYLATCVMCHGTDLKGPQSMGGNHVARRSRDLSLASNYRYGSTDQAIYRTIRYGIPRTAMGNYEKVLKPEQVWDLVNFLKSRWRADVTAPLPGFPAPPAAPPSHHVHGI
ncbi:cytochrome c [bacterium]|nr:cytochrome c [bacterium]